MPDPDDNQPDQAAINDQLQQAHQALSDATGARDADLSDAVVINRIYYACFHAAQAVLYDRGFNPDSHGGVLSLFGSEVVVAGDADRKDGRFSNRLSELRRQADYGYGTLDQDINALIARVQQFVSVMETLCSDSEN
ncbi:HEPN domain-containing protein [Haladaptatus sp. DYF46]|uniref:HEPN domain-containing protein n=1 Tax=Haladaptatus sp. DYF46 TaxID=2886041 RepID=UPI001E62CAA3|nr:HEPN domain-containing protein [Haladaptatus sp. DYF46]